MVVGVEQLVKGDFSCSVYFPLVNCVIAHGSGAATAQARPADEVTSFKLCARRKQSCHAGTEKSADPNPFSLTIICFALLEFHPSAFYIFLSKPCNILKRNKQKKEKKESLINFASKHICFRCTVIQQKFLF